MNKYFKNFILCGDADYHCLLCRENFQGLVDLEKHIRWEKHRKLLKGQTYYGKHQKNFIYKIGDNFYCEVCNKTIQSLREVTSHVNEELHKVNLKTPNSDKPIENMCQYNSGYVIVSDIRVSMQEWHCIVSKRCLLCQEDVKKDEDHIHSNAHVINIIKSKVMRDKDNLYREINEKLVYCFICKKTVSEENIEAHWSEQKHCELKNKDTGRVTTNNQAEKQEPDKKKDLDRILIETQRSYFEINYAKETAICKICDFTVLLDYKYLKAHLKNHTYKEKQALEDESDEEKKGSKEFYEFLFRDCGKLRSELSKYGKENYIKLNAGGSKGYCNLCDVSLSAHINVFEQHVKGECHSLHLEVKENKIRKVNKKPNMRSVPITKYLEGLAYSTSTGILFVKHFINDDQVSVDVPGFMLTKEIDLGVQNKKIKCFVCDVTFPIYEELKHYRTEKHKQQFLAAKVFEMAGELVREIRPNIYHCALCKRTFPSWERVELHVKNLNHRMKKLCNYKLIEERMMELKWSPNKVLSDISSNLDVFYVQLRTMGLF